MKAMILKEYRQPMDWVDVETPRVGPDEILLQVKACGICQTDLKIYKGEIPPRLFHPRRVLKGVHKGIIDGGNQSGIPTVNGSLYFDERFLGRNLGFHCSLIGKRVSHFSESRLDRLLVLSHGYFPFNFNTT